MKKSLSKQNNISKIPYSKSKATKVNIDSFKGINKMLSKNKNESNNKETVDGSIAEIHTFAYNHDSFNNSKETINRTNSLSKLDNKFLLFTSSLKDDSIKNNIILNGSKKIKIKKSTEFYKKNNINYDENSNNAIQNETNVIKDNYEEEDTNRIDYRYYPKIPEIDADKENNYFWLATYDKLMKKSKIIKILNYYKGFSPKKKKEILLNDENQKIEEKKDNSEKYNFKEKSIIIKGYEIYFLHNFNKPFIRPKKEDFIFIKLYLLNLEQFNKIFSYINRLEYNSYISNLDSIKEKNYFKIINKTNKTIYNYSTIFSIGTFANINIYAFSHIENVNTDNKYIFNLKDFPSSNKMAKLIKLLLINFPDYSKEYFINYLLKAISQNYILSKYDKESLDQKKSEISSFLISNFKESIRLSKKHKKSAGMVVKNVIQKIPTYTHSSNKTPNDFSVFSENKNISPLNGKINNTIDKSNESKKSDFSNKIKITKQNSVQNLNETDIQNLIKKKIRNIKLTRNKQNDNIYRDYTNKLKNNNNSKKIEYISDTFQHIKIADSNKESFTKNHTKRASKISSDKLKINMELKDNIINRFQDKSNKENNKNFMNSNKVKSKIKTPFRKTDLRDYNNKKINKTSLNPFNRTNANNINDQNDYAKKTRNKLNSKQLLSSIRRVISLKLNDMINKNDSLKSNNISNFNYLDIEHKNKIHYNDMYQFNNYNKKVCKTSNNSKNKIEYITPIRKKLSYYYN